MPSIAIVDDRQGMRETMCRVVQSTLKKLNESDNWSVVSEEPPTHGKDILHWLDENDATVLVSDWKLNEGAKSKRVVNYEADHLIQEIRAKRPTFPIFVVTGFEQEARMHFKDVENIFSRNDFTKNVDEILPQMLRAGRRRYDEQRELLTRMDLLAREVAAGTATAAMRKELKSLQGFFQAELPMIINLDGVLSEFEKIKQKADSLRRKVQNRIATTKKGKK